MNTRSLSFLLTLLTVTASVSAIHRHGFGSKLGGYAPIQNLQDPHVQEVAKYAVTEHNTEASTNLLYVNVIKGEAQVVSGMNYRLIISANDGISVRDYQAVVYERAGGKGRSLTSFKALLR